MAEPDTSIETDVYPGALIPSATMSFCARVSSMLKDDESSAGNVAPTRETDAAPGAVVSVIPDRSIWATAIVLSKLITRRRPSMSKRGGIDPISGRIASIAMFFAYESEPADPGLGRSSAASPCLPCAMSIVPPPSPSESVDA